MLLIVDIFTKNAHFLPSSDPFLAQVVAKLLLDNIHRLHGLSQSIITDREKVFTSEF